MSHRINARVDDELAAKVETLRRLTKKSTTDILRAAIDLYYDTVQRRQGRSAELLSESGFIGCGEGPSDLSDRYKEELRELLAGKT